MFTGLCVVNIGSAVFEKGCSELLYVISQSD